MTVMTQEPFFFLNTCAQSLKNRRAAQECDFFRNIAGAMLGITFKAHMLETSQRDGPRDSLRKIIERGLRKPTCGETNRSNLDYEVTRIFLA
jgi:hypothetical protein